MQCAALGGGRIAPASALRTDGSPSNTRFHEWLAQRKADAAARSGKPWSKSALAYMAQQYRAEGNDRLTYIVPRQPGELANPVTGEIVTNCVTLGKLAGSLGVTTDKLTDEMERRGLVKRVLGYREIPMVCDPTVRKPVYFQTPEVTDAGVEEGHVISINSYRDGMARKLILITAEGQALLRAAGSTAAIGGRQVSEKRSLIALLIQRGHTQAEIARLTGLPKQTVSRHARALREGAANCPIFE